VDVIGDDLDVQLFDQPLRDAGTTVC